MDRETILKIIRKNRPGFRPLPERGGMAGDRSVHPMEGFKKSLLEAGGKIVELHGEKEVDGYIRSAYPGALDFEDPGIWAEYPENCPKDQLENIGTAVLKGQFGVAENGAVWLDDSNFSNRLIPFIAERLVIKLSKEDIVEDMHGAYGRIRLGATAFGVFIAGPSKTADIEQSLVYGAHGAKELWVIIY